MKIKARFYTFEEWFKRVQKLAHKENINVKSDSLVIELLYLCKTDIEIAAKDLIMWERLIKNISPYSNYED